MLIITSEQLATLDQLQQDQPNQVAPLPLLDGRMGIPLNVLGNSAFDHLAEFLDSLPIELVEPAPSPMPGMSLLEAKQLKIRQINQKADQLLSDLVAGYPATERSTWPDKVREAEALLDRGVPATYLSVEAAERGVPVEFLAGKVLEKAGEFLGVAAIITGARGRHTDQVMGLESVEEVQAYSLEDW